MGVMTELFHPRMLDYYRPDRILETFQEYGSGGLVRKGVFVG